MVDSTGNVGYQAFAAQPAIAAGADTAVKPDNTQPRQAPPANTQSADQKSLASREEPPPPPPPKAANDSGRGQQVDVQA